MDFQSFLVLFEYGVRYCNPFSYSYLNPRGMYLWQYLGDIAPECLGNLEDFCAVRYDRSQEPLLLSYLESHWESVVAPHVAPEF